MLDAASKAITQILSPPFRALLWRSIGLALILIAIVGFGLHRLLTWLASAGELWAEGALGPTYDTPLTILFWVFSIAAGLGIIVGAIFLMPAVTSFVASFFVDDIAEQVEREYYPADPVGHAVPPATALWEGIKIGLLAVLVYLCALPFLLFAGFGFVIFFLATAYLLGRQYFELAAMRFRSPEEARELRRKNIGPVYTAGLLIAAFVSIPVVNLATPLFGTALMVHMHKRLSGQPRTELIEPSRT